MKPADQFEHFGNFQEIIGASDLELARLLSESCGPESRGNFEDALLEVMIRYFRYVTDIPWVREYEHGHRPDEGLTKLPDGQYGTVFIMWQDDEVATPITVDSLRMDPDTGEYSGDMCQVVTNLSQVSLRLRVFRDAGPGATQQTEPKPVQPARSAMDVLTWVKMRSRHWLMRAALAQYNIQTKTRFMGRITNARNMVNKTWESQASADFDIFVCTSSNLRNPALVSHEFVTFDFDCAADLEHIEKEPGVKPEC